MTIKVNARQGQGTLEYLLALLAILLAILYAARPDGPLQAAVSGLIDGTAGTIDQTVERSARRLLPGGTAGPVGPAGPRTPEPSGPSGPDQGPGGEPPGGEPPHDRGDRPTRSPRPL